MKTNNRMTRINDEIKKELSELFRAGLKDPRISKGVMISVTRVEASTDLKYCKVYYSVLGDEEEKAGVAQGIKNAAGYIRKHIAESVNLRNTPEFTFALDDSLEQGLRMSRLIDEVNRTK